MIEAYRRETEQERKEFLKRFIVRISIELSDEERVLYLGFNVYFTVLLFGNYGEYQY